MAGCGGSGSNGRATTATSTATTTDQGGCLRKPGQQYVDNEVVHIPRQLPDQPPVVIAFHGLREQPSTLESDTKLDDVADREGFIAAYPTAQTGGLHWRSPDVRYIRSFIDELLTRTCADPNRVYLTGFSNGAGFAWRAGCELADKVAAVAPVSGSYRAQPACPSGTRPMPTLEVHGRDPWTSTTARLVHDTVRRNHCAKRPRTHHVAPGVTREIWPGCNLQRIYNRSIGHQWLTAGDYDTSTEVWNFVKRFSTSGS